MHRTSLCRYGQHFLPTLLCGLALALPWLSPAPARGGVYIFAGDSNGLDVVTHPKGYTGTGGPLSVSVCIDPASPNARGDGYPGAKCNRGRQRPRSHHGKPLIGDLQRHSIGSFRLRVRPSP